MTISRKAAGSMRETKFLCPWGETGHQVEMLVQRPKVAGLRPAVMLMHGHQEHPHQPGARWAVGAGLFRSVNYMGYVAAAVSMPGYGRTGGLPDMCGPRSQAAVRAGLAHLRSMDGVDPTRIALCGWSRGAIVSACVAADEPGLCALVLSAGVYDFTDPDVFIMKEIQEVFFYETELGGRQAAEDRSALLRADRITSPTLILHGDSDERVNAGQATALHKRLQHLGRRSRLVTFEGAGHAPPRWQEGVEIMTFLKEMLG